MVLAIIEVSIKSICSTTESALRLMAIIEHRIKYGRNDFDMVIILSIIINYRFIPYVFEADWQ